LKALTLYSIEFEESKAESSNCILFALTLLKNSKLPILPPLFFSIINPVSLFELSFQVKLTYVELMIPFKLLGLCGIPLLIAGRLSSFTDEQEKKIE
jgi:hypothetical protein